MFYFGAGKGNVTVYFYGFNVVEASTCVKVFLSTEDKSVLMIINLLTLLQQMMKNYGNSV